MYTESFIESAKPATGSFWVIGFSVVNSPCRHAQQLEVTVRRSSVRGSLAQSKGRRREWARPGKKGDGKAGGNKEESTVFRVAI